MKMNRLIQSNEYRNFGIISGDMVEVDSGTKWTNDKLVLIESEEGPDLIRRAYSLGADTVVLVPPIGAPSLLTVAQAERIILGVVVSLERKFY